MTCHAKTAMLPQPHRNFVMKKNTFLKIKFVSSQCEEMFYPMKLPRECRHFWSVTGSKIKTSPFLYLTASDTKKPEFSLSSKAFFPKIFFRNLMG